MVNSFKVFHKKDSLEKELIREYGEEWLVNLKYDNHNDNLEIALLNENSREKIYYTGTKIIQRADPVLMMPSSKAGRAHFYAPAKRLGNITMDTFWFNTLAIWILTLIMYSTLRIDLLRKSINYFSRNSEFKRQ